MSRPDTRSAVGAFLKRMPSICWQTSTEFSTSRQLRSSNVLPLNVLSQAWSRRDAHASRTDSASTFKELSDSFSSKLRQLLEKSWWSVGNSITMIIITSISITLSKNLYWKLYCIVFKQGATSRVNCWKALPEGKTREKKQGLRKAKEFLDTISHL